MIRRVVLCLLRAACFIAEAHSQIPLAGLQGHYSLNGDASDAGVNGKTGTIHQTRPAENRFGLTASSLYFNGVNSFVEIPFTFDFYPRSIQCWFYAETDDYSDWKTILSLDNPGLEYGLAVVKLKEVNGRLNLHLSLSDVRKSCEVRPGEWFHLAMCTDEDRRVYFFLNGKPIHTDTLKNFVTSVDGLNSLILGSDRMAANRYFNGKLDDLLIYNRCLAPEAIDSIVNEDHYFSPLRIYPNPTPDILKIDCGGQFMQLQHQSFQGCNLLGQQLFSVPVTRREFTINLRERATPGVYLVYFRDAAGQVSEVHKVVMP